MPFAKPLCVPLVTHAARALAGRLVAQPENQVINRGRSSAFREGERLSARTPSPCPLEPQTEALTFSAFNNQHAAMRVVADPIGGVAEQASPKLGVVAVTDHHQVVASLVGAFH